MKSFILLMFLPFVVLCQNTDTSPFRQMYDLLQPANNYRTATGAPGHEYYQCRADYNINVELDDQSQKLYGEEIVTFYNNSPDILTYLWVQLDQNQQSKDSDSHKINQEIISEKEDITFMSKDK